MEIILYFQVSLQLVVVAVEIFMGALILMGKMAVLVAVALLILVARQLELLALELLAKEIMVD
jgi:hypothetical protein